jgi:predicted O-methyltransferase YrrM
MKTKKFHDRFLPNQYFYNCLYKNNKKNFNKELHNFLEIYNYKNFKFKFVDDDINNYTSMSSSPLFVSFLFFIIKSFNVKSFLEIGTYIGLTTMSVASFFLKNNINTKVTSIEKFSKFYFLAKNNFKKNKLDKNIDIHFGKAVEVVPILKKKFDLIFLDGGKIEYFQTFLCLEKYQFKKGTIVIIDDIFFHGDILNKKKGPEAVNLLKLIKYIEKKNKFDKWLLPLFGGILIIKIL